MATRNGRTEQQVRRDIEAERDQLAGAVEDLRGGLAEVTDIGARLRAKLPVVAVGAVGAGFVLVLAIVLAFWAATGAMRAVVKAVNRAYEYVETRPIWKVRLISLVLVLATGIVLVGTFMLIIFGGNLGDAIARRTPLGGTFM